MEKYRNRMTGKLVLFCMISLLIWKIDNAQVTLNGSFESLAHDETPRPWILQKDENYNIFIDSTASYTGRQSLRIKSTPVCAPVSSAVIFQVVDLAKFSSFKNIDIQLHLKFNTNDSTGFIPYVNLLSCPPAIQNLNEIRANVDSIKWEGKFEPDKWLSYKMAVHPKTWECKELYFGFVVRGIVDMNVDAVEVMIEGKKVVDLPLVNPPLPNEKDLKWLAKNVLDIHSTDDLTNFSDLSFLRRVIGNANVVALGESTHGTKEYFTLRHRIIKLLTEQLGFSVIAFENDMIATEQVMHAENDTIATETLLNKFFGRIHQTEEMASLFDYIKACNRSGKKHLYVEGIDNQSVVAVQGFLQQYLPRVDSQLIAYLPTINWQSWWREKGRKGYLDSLYTLSNELNKQFLLRKPAIALKLGSADSVLRVEKYISLLGDAIAFEMDKKKLTIYKTISDFRDSLMALNVLWLQKRYPGKKIIVWCHNDHIQKAAEPYHDGYLLATGYHLKKALGDKYKNFGFLTANGSATFYDMQGRPAIKELERPTADCYEYYLAALQKPVLYWQLPTARKVINEHAILLQRLKRRSMGFYFYRNQFMAYDLAKQFDGLFFISHTDHAHSFHFTKQ
jgi:erythromycin esterase